MSLVKTCLHRLGLLRLASQVRNGTWRYLQGGYSPRLFWQGWGEGFPDQKFQQEIHSGQKWLLEKLASQPDASVLEVGCGFGRNLDYLQRNLPGRSFSGMDISSRMAARARRSLPAGCKVLCADIQQLPFPARRFDVVFTHGLLMHVPPPSLSGALAEIRRVAGGRVLFVEETYWKGMEGRGPVNLNGYTFLHDYRSILVREGFQIREERESGEAVNLLMLDCLLPA